VLGVLAAVASSSPRPRPSSLESAIAACPRRRRGFLFARLHADHAFRQVLSPLGLEEEDWEVASPLQERPPSVSLK